MTLNPRLFAMLTLPPLLWAGNAVVGRITVAHVPPLTLNALRWLLAVLILLPMGYRALATAERRRDIALRWRPLATIGLLGVGTYNALQYLALTSSTPMNVTLIASSMPVWMLAVGALLHGEKPRQAQYLGASLSIIGVLIVLGRGDLATLLGVHFVRGDLYMLAAVLSWSLYSWHLARPAPSMRGDARPMIREPDAPARPWNWAELLLVQALFGLGWACLAAVLEQASGSAAPIEWSPAVFAALAFVAIGPSVLAYWCWGTAVGQAGPTVAGFYSNLTPLFAALLSTLLLGDPPRPYHALAFAFIVAGIWVSSRTAQKVPG